MNLIEITNKFPIELDAVKYFESIRWEEKKICPYCNSGVISNRHKDYRFHCKSCRKSFSVTTNTNLHNTRLELKTWLYAFAIIADAKKGISAKQLERNLGIHYETAWSMYHKIRGFMKIDNEENNSLKGITEMDEAYLGGKPRKARRKKEPVGSIKDYDDRLSELSKKGFTLKEGKYKKPYKKEKPKRGRGTDKIPIVGIVQRNGNVVAEVMEQTTSKNLRDMVKKHVDMDKSVLITDDYKGYSEKISEIIEHIKIDHTEMFSYRGINTNSIESFWAIIKRGILGQYHQVSKEYLPDYIEEFVFKYNNRKNDDMFKTLVINSMKDR